MHGSCLCGAIHYEIDGLSGPINHCSCRTCRKAHAAAFASTAAVDRTHFRWLSERTSCLLLSPRRASSVISARYVDRIWLPSEPSSRTSSCASPRSMMMPAGSPKTRSGVRTRCHGSTMAPMCPAMPSFLLLPRCRLGGPDRRMLKRCAALCGKPTHNGFLSSGGADADEGRLRAGRSRSRN